MNFDEKYWSDRYVNEQTGWDIGYVSDPIKAYADQLRNKELRILVPGAGNSYEAEYLHAQGFENVYVVDISQIPLDRFAKRYPEFPKHQLLKADFFQLESEFDLIIEQTFFCSLPPQKRQEYALKVHDLLSDNGKLVGVLFEDELFKDHPPFGGFKEDYIPFFKPYFDFKYMERCYNSIKPRAGRELFINLVKKS